MANEWPKFTAYHTSYVEPYPEKGVEEKWTPHKIAFYALSTADPKGHNHGKMNAVENYVYLQFTRAVNLSDFRSLLDIGFDSEKLRNARVSTEKNTIEKLEYLCHDPADSDAGRVIAAAVKTEVDRRLAELRVRIPPIENQRGV